MLDSVEVWPASSRCEWLVTMVIGTKTVEVKNMIISYIFAFSLHWLLKFAKKTTINMY